MCIIRVTRKNLPMKAEAMKSHDFLVGMIILSISIVIFGVLLSQSIEQTGSDLRSTLRYIADLLRGTLLTIADAN